jgi:hypothetical protein
MSPMKPSASLWPLFASLVAQSQLPIFTGRETDPIMASNLCHRPQHDFIHSSTPATSFTHSVDYHCLQYAQRSLLRFHPIKRQLNGYYLATSIHSLSSSCPVLMCKSPRSISTNPYFSYTGTPSSDAQRYTHRPVLDICKSKSLI